MADDEFRCFVGGLSWSTSDRGLKEAFEKFGHLLEAKVVMDRESGRSRGFGFVTFDEKLAMEEAIEAMNGMDLDGRAITVDKAQPQQSSGSRDYGNDRSRDRDRGDRRDRGRDGGGRGSGGGECFKCGKPGHFARECPSGDGGAKGGKYGGRDDKYGSSEGGRYGPDRGGDRFGGRDRDSGGRGGGGDRYNRDRAGPYDRRSSGGSRFWGWFFLIVGSFSFAAFLYAAVISKLHPPSNNCIIHAIQNDWYYCFLVPLTLPILLVAVYFHWLSMKLFKHA